MADLEAIIDDLPAPQRRVLLTALRNNLGFWEGSGFSLETMVRWFPEEFAVEAEGAIGQLEDRDLLEEREDLVYFQKTGFQVAQRLLQRRVADPNAGLRPVPPAPQGFPWVIANPNGTRWTDNDSFRTDLKVAERDASIREELLKKMEAVLREPRGYGKWLTGRRKGQKRCIVAHNYRLVWTPGAEVAFVLFCSKEDPRYSPFGA